MRSAKAYASSHSHPHAFARSYQAVNSLTKPASLVAAHTVPCRHALAQPYASSSWLPAPSSVRPQTCRHNSGSGRFQTRVFDKFRDMLGGSSGWAGPPEGRAEPAAAAAAGAASEEEDEEGAEMVKLDTEGRTGLGGTEEAFGPLAVLLVGFMQHEVDAFRAVMNEMDADIVKLIPCQRSMLEGSLLEAFQTECPQYEQPPLGQRRALFLSGMYGSEITEVIAAYRDAGLPPCVFAGLVPKNAHRSVGSLLEAVWKDHAAMMAKLQQESPEVVEDSF